MTDIDFVEKPAWVVLIADDSSTTRQFIRSAVRSFDRHVTIEETADGQQTLDALTSRPVDLAFLDLAMPEIHGEDVVRTFTVGHRMPFFVVVSGIGDPEQIARMRRLAAYDYLRKPVEAEAIHKVLATYERVSMLTRVLIVDDSRTQRKLIRRILAESVFHLTIDEAGDGVSAFEAYARQPADIVILDINMDGLDGPNTLRILRAHNPQVRVVLMSSDAAAIATYAALNVTAVLKKPFTSQDLDAIFHGIYGLDLPYRDGDATRYRR
ncbi:response regulator [Phreatobacter sp.]|uniref:response regulator n=1 Tax=Phreatobacter sp. TaxID=1966341 RepID=UPI003F6F9D0E